MTNVDVISVLTNNTEGIAGTTSEQYQLAREAAKLRSKELGLGNCRVSNIIHASHKIREADLQRRKTMDPNDKSTDLLGNLRDSSIHNGLMAILFTKEQAMLMAGLLKNRQLILYYDATGNILKLSRHRCGTSKHLLTSILSFAPAEHFLKKDEYEFKAELFTAFKLGELISHEQSSKVHANFVRQLMDACRTFDKNCPPPLLVNTDHDGALQNGWIEGCRTEDDQVKNRITWANVATAGMLWYEYLVDTNATFQEGG